jgi:hypothetical protein
MWNKSDLKQFQVLGSNLQATLGGFGSFTLIASKFLLEEGIGSADETGLAHLQADQWYPLDAWVRVFDRIHAEFGNFTLRQVGMHIPRNTKLPPQIKDIHTCMQFLDLSYHFNHGINGVSMFNLETGEMKEGIGHYKYVAHPPTAGVQKISLEVEAPYPCPFDEGLVTAAAQLFKANATVTHDKAGCRSRGSSTCTYHVTWK